MSWHRILSKFTRTTGPCFMFAWRNHGGLRCPTRWIVLQSFVSHLLRIAWSDRITVPRPSCLDCYALEYCQYRSCICKKRQIIEEIYCFLVVSGRFRVVSLGDLSFALPYRIRSTLQLWDAAVQRVLLSTVVSFSRVFHIVVTYWRDSNSVTLRLVIVSSLSAYWHTRPAQELLVPDWMYHVGMCWWRVVFSGLFPCRWK